MAACVVALDRTASTAARRIEAALILLFGVGVAGTGIGHFAGHFLFQDPAQVEMAYANLAIGALGIAAAYRRDRVREATVIAVTISGVAAGNLLLPACLIPLLIASRLVERSLARGDDPRNSRPVQDTWPFPLVLGAYLTTAIVGTTAGVGFAVGEVATLSILGAAMAIAVTAGLVARSRMLSEARL